MELHGVLCSYYAAQNPLAVILFILDVCFCELEMWTGRWCEALGRILIQLFQYSCTHDIYIIHSNYK